MVCAERQDRGECSGFEQDFEVHDGMSPDLWMRGWVTSQCCAQIGKIKEINAGSGKSEKCMMAWFYRPEEAEGGRKVNPGPSP